jgi:hypothetical protein
MILGSQRSPSNKKDNHINRRFDRSASKLSNDIFGNSFDGISAMSKINRTGGNAAELDLKNIEFEVSYDFTKDIETKNNLLHRRKAAKGQKKKKP